MAEFPGIYGGNLPHGVTERDVSGPEPKIYAVNVMLRVTVEVSAHDEQQAAQIARIGVTETMPGRFDEHEIMDVEVQT